MADLLFEIGLEEVPARMIAGAEAELLRRILAMLGKERLLAAGFDPLASAKSYSTPRRLAVWVQGLLERQEDVTEDVTGPAVKIAYKDGVPTPAAEAFARKAGVPVGELKKVQTPKGEYLAATSVKAGRSAAQVIATELPKELAAIYWAKNMYWRAGKPERFVRPVLWMVCLLDETVIPIEFGGRVAGNVTYGHRVLGGAEAVEIPAPEHYVEVLHDEFVDVDVEDRRHVIRKALDKVCREIEGARWREDHALVDKMVHLTEWPSVIRGSFEPEFLALPEEVLVTVMRDHQNYFAVESKEGKLMPHFLAVLNTEMTAPGNSIVRQGNERVLRARFNDARFFWEFDQRVPLGERVKLLENVTFQKDLGSYAAKTERVRALAGKFAVALKLMPESSGTRPCVDTAALDEAARLAKADLTSELVKEFTELQGIIGGLYARKEGASEVVWQAINDQYTPAGMDEGVPRSMEGAVLGIADRADTIAGMFGLGMEPTGSKDPFALRRAANGIVKILAETDLALTLAQVVSLSAKDEGIAGKMTAFFRERIEFYLREVKGQAYDVVAAVTTVGADDVRDVVERAEAVTAVRGSEDFAAVSAAFKRMKNILAQASADLPSIGEQPMQGTLPEQQRLFEKSNDLALRVDQLLQQRSYAEALRESASLRPEIDAFFDRVIVNDPDPEVRLGRLRLLREVLQQFSKVADFSEIVVAG